MRNVPQKPSETSRSFKGRKDHLRFNQILLVGIENILFLLYSDNNKSRSSNHPVSTRSFYNLLITS